MHNKLQICLKCVFKPDPIVKVLTGNFVTLEMVSVPSGHLLDLFLTR